MAKRIKQYSEAELIKLFNLEKSKISSPLMEEWLNTRTTLTEIEKYIFDEILQTAIENIEAWNEEDLKMNFISFVLKLGNLTPTKNIRTFFDRIIEGKVAGCPLRVKIDFMIAIGILDMPEKPYFHFQEYKRHIDPNGNPLAQLLTAMLIAQEINSNTKPIYGCSIVGKYWDFVILYQNAYYVSASYDCTDSDKLKAIIAILRNFRNILENRLIDSK